MLRYRLASAAVLATALVLTACLDDGEVTPAPGGFIQLAHVDYFGTDYNAASATFYANVSTAGAPVPSSLLPELATDTCAAPAIPTPTPIATPDIEYRDVGGAVTLSAGGSSVSLMRDVNGDVISYASTGTVEPEFGAGYDVVLGGGGSSVAEQSWTGALAMPSRLVVNGIQNGLSMDASAGHTVTWQSVGADAVVLSFQGANDTFATCLAADDGSFELPASFLGDLDADGSLTISAMTERSSDLDGRRVNLLGSTTVMTSYVVTNGPQPDPVTNCEIVWESPSAVAGRIDVYAIDVPIEQMTGGTKTYDGSTVLGVFLYGYANGAEAVGRAVSGTFDLTAEGFNGGDAITFDDASAQAYQDDGGLEIANGGTGSFSGTLTPLGQTEPVVGTGTITVTYGESTLTLGGSGNGRRAYAFCYDIEAVAPMTPEQRLLSNLARMH